MKYSLIIFFVLILISCTKENKITAPEKKLSSNFFLAGNFENDYEGWIVANRVGTDFSISSSEPYEGTKCAKISVLPNGRVAEIAIDRIAEIDTEMKYTWYMKIDSTYVQKIESQTVCQFHDKPDYDNGDTWETMVVFPPPVYLDYRESRIRSIIYTKKGGYQVLGEIEIQKGKWIKIEYNCNWRLDNNGYIETKINDIPITPFNGTDNKFYMPTIYNNQGNFLKIGLYRHPSLADSSVLYFDDMQIFKYE